MNVGGAVKVDLGQNSLVSHTDWVVGGDWSIALLPSGTRDNDSIVDWGVFNCLVWGTSSLGLGADESETAEHSEKAFGMHVGEIKHD